MLLTIIAHGDILLSESANESRGRETVGKRRTIGSRWCRRAVPRCLSDRTPQCRLDGAHGKIICQQSMAVGQGMDFVDFYDEVLVLP